MPSTRQVNANSESVDNYLKAILSLEAAEAPGYRVTSTALADRLGVAPASITNMLQKLASAAQPLVDYERHRGVRLSVAGKRRALEVLRHHRLLETFLYKVLDYPIEEVHAEAERLEHFISERFEERIAAKLGYPQIDPHGHSIPSLEGEMPPRSSIRLTEVSGGGTFVIDSVEDRDAPTLRQLEAAGIKAGARLKVKRKSDGYSVRVGRAAKGLDLTLAMAEDIRILPCEG